MNNVNPVFKQAIEDLKGGTMKIIVVVTERDGETTKKPGETSTKTIRRSRRYAAKSIAEVWKFIHEKPEFFGKDETLIGIYEVHPAIIVLKDN